MDLQLKGKRALVTGSGKGIGRGIAIGLAREGVKVAVNYNYNPATAEETMKMISDVGGEAVLIKADVSSAEGCKYLVEESARQLGGLDILVNNAALQTNLDLDEYDEEKYDLLMNTNLKGYWNCTRFAVPFLKECGQGRVIYISSVHGKRPTDFDPVYAMTKGGIKMLAREAAIELAQYRITCNVLLPGGVKIEFKTAVEGVERSWKMKRRERSRQYNMQPLGRGGLPSDLAYMVCCLASPLSEHISGSGLRMDGTAMLL